jgi:hypothetical protein
MSSAVNGRSPAAAIIRAGSGSAPSSLHPPVTHPSRAFFLLPIGDVEFEDNWFVCGLSGTGSKNVIVHEAFVPQHRMQRFADTRSGRTPGGRHHKNPLYRLPLLLLGATMLAATAVGAAKGAPESYLAMLRFAKASAAVEAAEMILEADLQTATERLRAGEEITIADRSGAAATRPMPPSSP